jgi:hypothetical protein
MHTKVLKPLHAHKGFEIVTCAPRFWKYLKPLRVQEGLETVARSRRFRNRNVRVKDFPADEEPCSPGKIKLIHHNR